MVLEKAIMDLQLLDLPDTYPSFDSLIKAINIFAFLQSYVIIKKKIKINKKKGLRKAILIYNQSKNTL